MNRLLQVQLLSVGQMVLRALFVFMDPVHVVCVCVCVGLAQGLFRDQ